MTKKEKAKKRARKLFQQKLFGLATMMICLMLITMNAALGETDFTHVMLIAPIGIAMLVSNKVIIV